MTDRQRADAHRPPVHRSVRARFAVATAGLLVGMGGLMLALVYVLMRYVPSYDITHTTTAAATTLTPGATPIGGLTTAPVHSLRRPPSTTRVAGRGCLLRSFAILIPFAQREWSGRKLAQAPTPVSLGVAGSAPHSLQLPS